MPDTLSTVSSVELLNVPGSIDPGASALKRGPVVDRIRSALNGLDLGFRAILVIALAIQLVIVLTGIVSRFWFDESLLWADEAAKLFLSLTAFVGGARALLATLAALVCGRHRYADPGRGRDGRIRLA